jgi:hypothetical protein
MRIHAGPGYRVYFVERSLEILIAGWWPQIQQRCSLHRPRLAVVACATGMTRLAQQTRLGRESLYKALSRDGNPSRRVRTSMQKG